MNESLSLVTALKSSWVLIKKHYKFLAPAFLATAAVFFLLQLLQNYTEGKLVLSIVAMIISTVKGIAITLGWSQVVLKLIRTSTVDWRDFQTDTKLWLHFFIARIIYGLFTAIALVIAVLPVFLLIFLSVTNIWLVILGILIFITGATLLVWLTTRYFFISFSAIDHPRTNGWKLLVKSSSITEGKIIQLALFLLVLLIINIIGMMLFFVGLAITIPLSLFAVGYLYEEINK